MEPVPPEFYRGMMSGMLISITMAACIWAFLGLIL
jgi:hypothetical protein